MIITSFPDKPENFQVHGINNLPPRIERRKKAGKYRIRSLILKKAAIMEEYKSTYPSDEKLNSSTHMTAVG